MTPAFQHILESPPSNDLAAVAEQKELGSKRSDELLPDEECTGHQEAIKLNLRETVNKWQSFLSSRQMTPTVGCSLPSQEKSEEDEGEDDSHETLTEGLDSSDKNQNNASTSGVDG